MAAPRPGDDPRSIVHRHGYDAGQRHCHAAGRTVWNGSDLDAAIEAMTALCKAWARERDEAAAVRVASECELAAVVS